MNVPSGVWIDEQGMIVRPPEPAFPGRAVIAELGVPAGAPPRIAEMLQEAAKIRIDPARYVGRAARLGRERRREPVRARARTRSWRAPRRARRRRRARPPASSSASTCTARGIPRPPSRWFREAHRLQPDNWTYKRQAWEFLDPIMQGPTEQYEGDWLTDVRKIGAENYYPPVDL